MQRFGRYFEDVMAGRKGGAWQGLALMYLAMSLGGAIVVVIPALAYVLLF